MNKSEFTRISLIVVRAAGYLFSMGLCVFFALYMSAGAGWMFFYVLAAALLFSFVVTLIARYGNFIDITAEADNTMVYKNETVKIKFTLKNRSILPIPAVIIHLKSSESFSNPKNSVVVSISPKSSTFFEVEYKANMWGGSFLGADSITMTDFMRFLSLPMYKERGLNSYSCEVKVIPDIPDIPSDTPLIKAAADIIRYTDESEDTKETDKLNLFGGMPGYSHREYEEGDPIRRINWKLSSKKDIYMVRLDDEIEAMQQVIVLDSAGAGAAENERAVEGLLSIVFSLFRLGFEATVWYNTKNGFVPFDVSDYGDVTALQTALADYIFISEKTRNARIPLSDMEQKKQAGGFMLITPCPDSSLQAEIEAAVSGGVAVTPVLAAESRMISAPYWLIREDYISELIS